MYAVTLCYFTILSQYEVHALSTVYTLSNNTKTKTFRFTQASSDKIVFLFIHLDNSMDLAWLASTS
jgi:hypothetical protein